MSIHNMIIHGLRDMAGYCTPDTIGFHSEEDKREFEFQMHHSSRWAEGLSVLSIPVLNTCSIGDLTLTIKVNPHVQPRHLDIYQDGDQMNNMVSIPLA